MPLNPQNILAHEWIGLAITIKESSDPQMRGLSGLIRDETRNTFLIETGGRLVRILKTGTVFQATATTPTAESMTVEGNLLRHRPEDRIKKGLAKW